MSEWLLGKLGDIAEIVMGQSPTGESVNTDGLGTPLLNGPTEFTIRYPQAVQFSTEPKRFSKVDDILFCVRGSTTGRMNWANASYAIGRGLAAIRHKQGKEYRYFVKAVLDYYLDTMLASASGSTFPNVSKDQLNDLEISYPPLPEQKAIASVLSSLDDKIDLLHRQNKTLETMAETLFRQWFIEEANEDWQQATLKDEFSFTMGQSPSGSSFNEDSVGTPMFQGNADFGFRFPKERVYTTEPARFAYPLDTLISVRAPVGAQNMAKVECCIGRGVAAFRHAKNPQWYTYTYYKLNQLMNQIKQFNDEGTVFGSISKSDFERLEVVIPPNEAVFAYEQTAKPLNDKIIANVEQIQTLENLRDTLLPKLMSGEVRVQYQTEEVA
ncbi:restriction endonuclease subunit S [Acinetobacter baumannii]|uniref:restriction endonuclease subunit S n=1 Tax=Acinetobacter baumannii TaxID=470 RepID=UPI001FF30C60|nr:restriction endonuclease subunit S [Acinetobacter baumannii]MCJ8819541.1 restriction endonuclease subunit S [Acinetobacter baumannii]MCJ8987978.1 restriction endonuclease subunit S [Acinetobacter baumannii]MCJ8991935.1 restriction endonuclease subunit S [Acinetobacter baumannii]